MVYAPGCALLCYKPHLAEKLGKVIAELYGDVDLQQVCCFDRPALDEGTHIITPCSTCIRQYEQNYPQCITEFFLKTLLQSESFPFPDYGGIRMTIQDACGYHRWWNWSGKDFSQEILQDQYFKKYADTASRSCP